MDIRKSALTAPAGTLRVLKNAHVTPGGEIEKRKKFETYATAPASSVGLMGLGSSVYVVIAGTTSIPPSGGGLGQHAVALPAGVTPTELMDWDVYDNKFFCIVRGSDGTIYRSYNGALVPTAKGVSCRTYKSKVYSVNGSILYFSAVGDPTDWDTAAEGAGFINLGTEDSEMSALVSLEVYYDKLAIFSQRTCQIWFVDPDPNKNTHFQTLRQAGTYAAKSVRQYGSGDVLYLSPDGVRSLKARMQSVTASVSDIGSPVDRYIRDQIAAGKSADLAKATSLLEPLTGRYWVVTPDNILVLSNYPSPEISAWCIYEPGFRIKDAAAIGPAVYLRGEDNIIRSYGGSNVPVYDNCAVEVILPYLSFSKPATMKQFSGIDLSATGSWDIYAAMNPHDQTAEDLLGTATGPPFLTGQFPVSGQSTHISLRLRSVVEGHCTLSNLMVHYTEIGTS